MSYQMHFQTMILSMILLFVFVQLSLRPCHSKCNLTVKSKAHIGATLIDSFDLNDFGQYIVCEPTHQSDMFKDQMLYLFVIVRVWAEAWSKPGRRFPTVSTKSVRLTSHWIWIWSSIVLSWSWWRAIFYAKLSMRSRPLQNAARTVAKALKSGNWVLAQILDPWLGTVLKPRIFCLFIPIDTFVNWLLSKIMIRFLTPTFKRTVFHIAPWFL